METVEAAIRRMQKSLTAGSLESAQAAQTFQELGLSVKDLMKLNVDQQFAVIAQRIGQIKNATAGGGAAMMIFGRSGEALIPMSKRLQELTSEFGKLGGPMSKEAAEAAERLEHSMMNLEVVTKKIVMAIGSALAPTFEAWNKTLARVEKGVLDLVKANKPLIVTIAGVGFALVAAGTAIVTLGTVIWGFGQTIGAVSAVIGLIGAALGLLLTPLGLVAIGFVGMTTAMGAWGDAAKMASGMFSGLLETVQETAKGMGDALKAGDIKLAAEILFAGLKVEFLKGTTALTKIWSDWSFGLLDEFDNFAFGVQRVWIDLSAKMEGLFAKIQANTLAAAGTGSLASGLGRALGIIPGAVEAPPKEAVDIEARRAAAQDALTRAQDADEEARRTAADDAVAAAEKELIDAKKKLREKAHEAAILPVEASGEGGMGGARSRAAKR